MTCEEGRRSKTKPGAAGRVRTVPATLLALCLLLALPVPGPAAADSGGAGCACDVEGPSVCVMPFADSREAPQPSSNLAPLLELAAAKAAPGARWVEPRTRVEQGYDLDPVLFSVGGSNGSAAVVPEAGAVSGAGTTAAETGAMTTGGRGGKGSEARAGGASARGSPDPEVYFQLRRNEMTRTAVSPDAEYVARVQVIAAGSSRSLVATLTDTGPESRTVLRSVEEAASPEEVPAAVRRLGEGVGTFLAEENAYRCLDETQRQVLAQLCTPAAAVAQAEARAKRFPDSLRLRILLLNFLQAYPAGRDGDRAAEVAGEVIRALVSDSGQGMTLLQELNLDPFLVTADRKARAADWAGVLDACRAGQQAWTVNADAYRARMAEALARTGRTREAEALCEQLRQAPPADDSLAERIRSACPGGESAAAAPDPVGLTPGYLSGEPPVLAAEARPPAFTEETLPVPEPAAHEKTAEQPGEGPSAADAQAAAPTAESSDVLDSTAPQPPAGQP